MRRWSITLAISVIVFSLMVLAIGKYMNYVDQKIQRCLVPSRAIRLAKAVVVRKNNGDMKIYYRIKSFDSSDTMGNVLLEIEKKKNANGELRDRITNPEEFEKIKVGDVIEIRYQRFCSASILTW